MSQLSRENFLTEVAKLLEVDMAVLKDDFELNRCSNWDSLTAVSVIGLLDTLFSVHVPVESIEKIQTVKQLLALTAMQPASTMTGVN